METVRQGLLKKSRNDRIFFDYLCLEIWCQCKEGGVKSTDWREWGDMLLPCYSSGRDAIEIEGQNYSTARKKLNKKELDKVQDFINTNIFYNITDAKRKLADGLFSDCIASALNVLSDE